MNIAFLHHGNLVEQEIVTALHGLPGVKVVVIQTKEHPLAPLAEHTCGLLTRHECAMLFTVNDWGIDSSGVLQEYIETHGLLHVNWYVDDPYYGRIIQNLTFAPSPNRFDFISDRGYVEPMRKDGYQACFLPLGCDPSIFTPPPSRPAYVRDICFVGNSYCTQIDSFVKDCHEYIEAMLPFLHELLQTYRSDMSRDIEAPLRERVLAHPPPEGISHENLIYKIKHFIGYLFRKDIVIALAKRHPDFMAFGDEYWVKDIPVSQVSMGVGYYTNLCATYQQTRVNIDINRMVIRDGFTQRIFDALCCGSFIITSPKKVVHALFTTHGPQQEVVVFRTKEHLLQLIDYYLAHPKERQAIAARGMQKVRTAHTYLHRVQTIFSVISDHKKQKRRTGFASSDY